MYQHLKRYTLSQAFKKSQTLLQYRIRGGKVKFASNAFFFAEGTAGIYEKAKYGEFTEAEIYIGIHYF